MMEIYEFSAIIAFLVMFLLWALYEFRKIKNELSKVQEKDKEHTRKISELEALSTIDDLTGILNRRGCMEVLGRLWSILSRHKHEENDFTVILLDLCFFKMINDTYGHDVGDRVLRFFVSILQTTLPRKSDTIARLGGDEFLIILPGSTMEQAQKVEGMIHVAFMNTPFRLNGINLNIHVSAGIETARDPISGIVRPLPETLRLADIAMYQRKKEDHKILGRK